jgi:hypothetical protein
MCLMGDISTKCTFQVTKIFYILTTQYLRTSSDKFRIRRTVPVTVISVNYVLQHLHSEVCIAHKLKNLYEFDHSQVSVTERTNKMSYS